MNYSGYAERRCLAVFENGEVCVEIQNLEHLFFKCKKVQRIHECMKLVLETFLDHTVSLVDWIIIPCVKSFVNWCTQCQHNLGGGWADVA